MSVKTRAQALLKTIELYDRLKASRLYDVYWMMADRRIIDQRRAELQFYRAYLQKFRPGHLFFDIGANHGHKTDIFLRMGARIVAVEPDRHSQEVLRRRFLRYRFVKKPVVIVGMAASDRDGFDTLWLDAPGSAKNTLNSKWVGLLRADERRFGKRLAFANRQEIETVRMETLIAKHGVPFFIKIDVEGHEPSVLRGLRHAVPYLSFEVNLPEFRSEGQQCIELLTDLAAEGQFNYAVDCQSGFALQKWVDRREFLPIFNDCIEKSIEVFWTRDGRSCHLQ
jgi:FkbM family methyltransferase